MLHKINPIFIFNKTVLLRDRKRCTNRGYRAEGGGTGWLQVGGDGTGTGRSDWVGTGGQGGYRVVWVG